MMGGGACAVLVHPCRRAVWMRYGALALSWYRLVDTSEWEFDVWMLGGGACAVLVKIRVCGAGCLCHVLYFLHEHELPWSKYVYVYVVQGRLHCPASS
jgi:hypothetical protein